VAATGAGGPGALTGGASPLIPLSELHAAILQAAITLGIAGVSAVLYARFRKPHFFWWAVAWALYVGRLGAILVFVPTAELFWLYAHQVATGWTALALLWSALVFSRGATFRRAYLLIVMFPPLWSYYAIFHLGTEDRFLYAALPAVLFLSGATLWTAGVFFRFRRQTGSSGAGLLAAAFLLWGLHHLDYPILRARGAWNPWGYYLDIVFALLVGTGIVWLVIEDLQRGVSALSTMSGDLQPGEQSDDVAGALLARALVLPGVRGSALYDRELGVVVRGLGTAAAWEGQPPDMSAQDLIGDVLSTGGPSSRTGGTSAYAAALPVMRREEVAGVMLILGDARDPFTALDTRFLRALGQQVGAALENADLGRRLRRRTAELERLSTRMVQQHEEERRRLSLELHDETAQVFSAVKLRLGLVREQVPPLQADQLGRVVELVDEGMASIRSVTEALRPSLLDDLGLLPAIRALAGDFEARTGVRTTFTGPEALPRLSEIAELALFRAVQEGLSNIARHADAEMATVDLLVDGGHLLLEICDDGPGPGDTPAPMEEHMGLTGMRERVAGLGGSVTVERRPRQGVELRIRLPLNQQVLAP
jgi:signal transduction histidine kinase